MSFVMPQGDSQSVSDAISDSMLQQWFATQSSRSGGSDSDYRDAAGGGMAPVAAMPGMGGQVARTSGSAWSGEAGGGYGGDSIAIGGASRRRASHMDPMSEPSYRERLTDSWPSEQAQWQPTRGEASSRARRGCDASDPIAFPSSAESGCGRAQNTQNRWQETLKDVPWSERQRIQDITGRPAERLNMNNPAHNMLAGEFLLRDLGEQWGDDIAAVAEDIVANVLGLDPQSLEGQDALNTMAAFMLAMNELERRQALSGGRRPQYPGGGGDWSGGGGGSHSGGGGGGGGRRVGGSHGGGGGGGERVGRGGGCSGGGGADRSEEVDGEWEDDTVDQSRPSDETRPEDKPKDPAKPDEGTKPVAGQPGTDMPPGVPPVPGEIPPGAYVANGLSSYRNVQEPSVLGSGGEEIKNIRDVGNGITEFRLRMGDGWRDDDRNLGSPDRQRAETRQLGEDVFQQEGETWEYGSTFRTDPNFQATGRFCHVMQIKGYSGDNGRGDLGMPLATVSITDSQNGMLTATVSRTGGGEKVDVATFQVKAGDWVNVRFRVRTGSDGMLQASINNSEWKGLDGLNMSVPRQASTDLKVGLYRSINGMESGWDNYVQHQQTYRAKIG